MKKVVVKQSKKLVNASKLIEADKTYTIDEAIDLIKKTSYARFDATVEAHFNLDVDIKATDQSIRTTSSLPHGTGKEVKVATFSTGTVKGADLSLNEEGIALIEQGKLKPKVDFDIIASEPTFMPKLAKIAKILGPAGMMPNPKTGTVSADLEKTVAELKKGRVELRCEPNAPIIHTKIGKISFKNDALKENFLEVLKTLKAAKPQKAKPEFIKSCYLSSTMGPSVLVAI